VGPDILSFVKTMAQVKWLQSVRRSPLAKRMGLAALFTYVVLNLVITLFTVALPARFVRFLETHFPGKLAARSQFINKHASALLFYYSVLAACGLAFLVWRMWRDDVEKDPTFPVIERFTGLALSLFVVGTGCLLTGYLLFDKRVLSPLYLVVAGPRLLAYLRVYAVVSIIAAGGCLYAFKRLSKLAYGCTEVLVALAANWAIIRNLLPGAGLRALSLAQGLGLVGTLYFFSRGFGNIVEGLEERSKLSEQTTRTEKVVPELMDSTEEEGL
jgi:hypothetical protein